MGTRADFYVGRGPDAEWIGSIAWDGYPNGDAAESLLGCGSEESFKAAVAVLSERGDFTKPEMGWPWPWENSHTTDFAYAFDSGVVYASSFGHGWRALDTARSDECEWDEEKTAVFPDMSARENLAMGTARDSIMIISARRGRG